MFGLGSQTVRVYSSRLGVCFSLSLRLCASGMSPASLYIIVSYGIKKHTYKRMLELPLKFLISGCGNEGTKIATPAPGRRK